MNEIISVPIVGYIEGKKIIYYKRREVKSNENQDQSKEENRNKEKSSRQETDSKASNT